MAKTRKRIREQLLDYVDSYSAEHGYPPTLDEIRAAVGLSSRSHVRYYLDGLERDGLLVRRQRSPRGLRLSGLVQSTFEVAVEGSITAGEPLQLAAGSAQTVELTADIADPTKDLFALRVRGKCMVEAMVTDGDLLIVERQGEARHGDTVVVHLRRRNEASVRRAYPDGESVRLQPLHPDMAPTVVRTQDVSVQGRVVAVVREL
jgi:repressor LexA